MKQIIKLFIFSTMSFLFNCQIWQHSFSISLDSLVYQKCELENSHLFDYVLIYYDQAIQEVKGFNRKSKIRINFSGESIIPIVLYPRIKNTDLKPAGGIFPFDYSETQGELKLCWEKGPLAEGLLKLLIKKCDLQRFNILKLEKYLKIKFSNNPWAWDRRFFIQGFIKGNFNYFDIKKKESQDIILKLTEGQYYSDHPFTFFSIKKEKKKKIRLFLGYNRIFNSDFSTVYSIYVNNQDYCLIERTIK